MPWLPLHGERRRFQLHLEHLEDRCVPSSTTLDLGHSSLVSQIAHVGDAGSAVPPVTTTIGTAVKNAKALKGVITHLAVAQIQAGSGSFTSALLGQSIQLTQAENAALNKLIKTLKTTKLTPGQAYVKLFTLQTNFVKANVTLQVFQNQEVTSGTMSPFSIPRF